MKTAKSHEDVYTIVNTRIIEKLEQCIIPWKQTWNAFGPPRNYVSGRPYHGINAFLLNHTKSEYPLFLTFHQAQQLGGSIRKGSCGHLVIFWKKLQYQNKYGNTETDVKTISYLRYYHVFNIDCVEGVTFEIPEHNSLLKPIEQCEQVIAQMPNRPALEYGGDEPAYDRILDRVKVPHLANFKTEEEYYATIFHELAHSTGHASRLDRDMSGGYGSKQYSFEELVAESTACLLANKTGIAEQVLDNSTAYIKFWLERLKIILKEDQKFLVRAFAEAQRAADYILNVHEQQLELTQDHSEVNKGKGG